MRTFLLLDNVFASLSFGVVVWFALIGLFPHIPNACLDGDAAFQRQMGEQISNAFALAGAAGIVYGVMRGVVLGRRLS